MYMVPELGSQFINFYNPSPDSSSLCSSWYLANAGVTGWADGEQWRGFASWKPVVEENGEGWLLWHTQHLCKPSPHIWTINGCQKIIKLLVNLNYDCIWLMVRISRTIQATSFRDHLAVIVKKSFETLFVFEFSMTVWTFKLFTCLLDPPWSSSSSCMSKADYLTIIMYLLRISSLGLRCILL